MLETSSEKAAEAVTPFASPLLASVERLVSRLASRIAGPQSQFSGRSLQFADRILARQLANLGGGGAAPEALTAEREIEPQKWLLPDSWVPSAAALRGGAKSAPPPAKAAAAPANLRAPAPPLVLATPPRQPDAAVKPAGSAVAPLPVAVATTDSTIATGQAAQAPTSVSPTAATAATTAAAQVTAARAAPDSPGASASTAPAGEPSAAALAGPTPAQSAQSAAPLETPPDSAIEPAGPSAGAPQTISTVLAGAPTTGQVALPAAAAPTGPIAARPSEPATAGVTELERTAPSVAPARFAQPASPASRSAEPAASPAASTATAAVEASPSSARPSASATQLIAGSAAPTSAAALGVDLGSAQPSGLATSAISVPSVGAEGALPVAATPSSSRGQAGISSSQESVLRPQGPPASIGSGPITGAVVGQSAAASPTAGPRQPTGSGLGEVAQRDLPTESGPRMDASAGSLAQAVVAGADEPGASGPAASPGGTRVRDWLQPLLRRPAASGGALTTRVSAFARSLGHLSWSDDRLGRRAAQRGSAAAPHVDEHDELASSPRAAAAPSLPMVQATELTPRAAARLAKLPSKLATEAATPALSGEPLRKPLVALPMAADGGAPQTGRLAAPAGTGPRSVGSESAAVSAEIVAAMAAGDRGQARPGTASVLTDAESALARPAGTTLTATSPAAPLTALGLDPTGRVGGGAGTARSSLSPGLLDSSALRQPREAGGPASFVEMFLAGQAARTALPSAWTLPSLATSQPYRTPGALALHTEQMANVIGTHAAAGSAGVDNPFGGVQRWRAAPGLAGTVARALGGAAPPGAARWAQLSLSKELPYLESPDSELDEPTARAAGAATATPALTLVPPVPGPREEAPLAARQPVVGPLAPAAPFTPLAEPSGDAGAPRPWQLAGGMATLAELFAAGVGLGSGAAVDLARQAGVAPAAGLLPPWLSKAAAQSSLGLLSFPEAGPRAAELGSADTASEAALAGGPLARALRRAGTALPLGASPASLATLLPVAAAFAPAASDKRTRTLPFWQQAGGLAATAEAFARGHGIERAESRALGASARATTGRWIPITGGMVFIDDEMQEESTAASAAGAPGGSSAWASSQPLAMIGEPTATGRAPAGRLDPAGRVGAWPPAAAAAELAASGELQAATRATGPLGRGVDFGRVGGLGLRTELFAAGLGTADLRARPLGAAQDPAAWSMAPGVASPLAEALSNAEPQTPARWTFGERGLLFLSSSGSSELGGAGAGGAAGRGPAGTSAGRQTSATIAAESARLRAAGLAQVAGKTMPGGTGARDESEGAPGLSSHPWLRAGGMATLAELFSAGVGLGAGAASSLAHQAGVAAGRGFLPGWLARLLTAGQSLPSEDDGPQMRPAMPLLPRDEQPSAASRLPGGPRRRSASAPYQALPVASTLAATTERSLGEAATGERRPLLTTAAVAAASWQRAGGLGASAEAFARGHGLARTDGDSADYDDNSEAPAGRWLAVSGGLVFVPAERPAAGAAKRGSAARPATRAAASPTAQLPAAPAGRLPDGSAVGGLGLRSELFASGLGQSAAGTARTGGDPLGGWAGAHRLLTSFPQQELDEPVSPSRFAWSGAGGLLYLAGASPSPRGQQRTAAPARRSPAVPAGATTSSAAGTSAAAQLPGGVAALAEQFGAARRSSESPREAERAEGRTLPLASLFGGQSAPPATGSAMGAALPGRLAEAMLTGFPRRKTGGQDAAMASATGSHPAMHSVERLSRLLGQLPAQWLPSSAVTTALQSGGVTESAIWQRLPASLTRLAAAALRGDQAGAADSDEEPQVERHSHLTLVKGGSPAAQKAQRPVEPAWKQQTPQAMVSAALQKVAGSGTPMAAAAKMLETLRGQGGAQGVRADDRLSLGDLTLIAISMGDNRMAAISKSGTPSTIPHVESALRQDDHQLVQPETEHTMNKKIDALAKMCLKYVDKHEQMMKERGSFDS